ncbi:MAG: flavodoxin family protein [Treponema sp.]|jgi:flavodoxin|nr:flavodoxin family protein [Treponema sp.]
MKDQNERGLIVYSSKTGNTRKLAEGIRRVLEDSGFPARIAAVEEKPDPAGAPWVLVGFWADRGQADEKARDYIRSLEGRRLGLFGTLGAYPDSDHAKSLAKKTEALAAEKNSCLGSFLCQGKVDPALIERFKTLPPDNPHAMTEERRKRHEEAAKHPNEDDIAAAAAAFLKMIGGHESPAAP